MNKSAKYKLEFFGGNGKANSQRTKNPGTEEF